MCSGKDFNITNVGVPRTWILLDIQSMINFSCNRDLLDEVAHMEGSMAIHCSADVVHTSIAVLIPVFKQEITW